MEEKQLRSDLPTPAKLVAIEATHTLQENRKIGRFVHAMLPRLLAARSGFRLVMFARGVAVCSARQKSHIQSSFTARKRNPATTPRRASYSLFLRHRAKLKPSCEFICPGTGIGR